MVWISRETGAADVVQLIVEESGLGIGDLIAVQHPGAVRHWTFKLRTGGKECLRWDYLPAGALRKHPNRAAPPGFPNVDRSLVHEHPPENYDRYSLPLPSKDTGVLRQAFEWFCDRANIDPDDVYREPPTPQLALIP